MKNEKTNTNRKIKPNKKQNRIRKKYNRHGTTRHLQTTKRNGEKTTMRLTTEEWETLDTLIGKHGFGGYYDLIECLKISIQDMLKVLGKDKIKVPPINDLPSAVHVINLLSSQLKEMEQK